MAFPDAGNSAAAAGVSVRVSSASALSPAPASTHAPFMPSTPAPNYR